jgi:hypothetical protein
MHEWRVPRRVPLIKAGVAAVFVGLAVATGGDATRLTVAGAAAVVLLGLAARDLAAPVRLAADSGGVTVVHGFAGRRTIPWAEVERVRVDTRMRLGLRSQLLEVDAGESLHLFSASELGTECAAVAATLTALRTGHPVED